MLRPRWGRTFLKNIIIKKMKKIVLILVLVNIVFYTFSQNYEIKIKVKGVKKGDVYLGHYYGDSQYVIDTTSIDKKGFATFKGDKKLGGGVYLVLFPSRDMSYFEILMGDDQEFVIETDTLDFYKKNMKVKGSIDNKEFLEFKKKDRAFGVESYFLQSNYKKYNTNKDSVNAIRDRVTALTKKREAFLKETVTTAKSKTLKAVVNLMRDVEIPSATTPENATNKDSIRLAKYNYYKTHYWDYVDFTDSTILKTQLFEPKLKRFMTQIIAQRPDTIIKEGNLLIEKAKPCPLMYRYMVEYMLGFADKSKLMGMDKVFVETAKTYHLKGLATWADSSRIAKIKSSVEKIEPNLVGNIAPDLQRLESVNHKYYTLSEIKSEYTVLAFWEPHCGHCKIEIPRLYKAYERLKAKGIDIEVMAVYTQVKRESWEKFIEEKEIDDWINVYDKYQRTNFRKLYNVYATPSIYLLDKNKKIIGKKLGAEQVEKFLINIDKLKKGAKSIK